MNQGTLFKAILHDFLKIWIFLNVIVNAIGDINKHLYCWKQGCLFFKKIWIIPQHYIRHLPNPSPHSSPTPKLEAPPNQRHRSVFCHFLWWFGGASQGQMPAWTYGQWGCLRGDEPPSEARKFCIFETGIMQFGEYFWVQIQSRQWAKITVLWTWLTRNSFWKKV